MSIFYELWHSVPPITRTILLLNITLSLLVSLDLCTPYKLYFNYYLIKNKGQVWRAVTSLFYVGELSPHTIFDFVLFYYNSSKLEQHDFRNKPADLIMFYFFSCCSFLVLATYLGLQFLSPCLSATVLYVWTRRNPNVEVNLMEIFTFRAQFLPWFLMLLVVVFGFDAQDDLVGALVGHIYYYFADVVPKIPETKEMHLLKAPHFLTRLCEWLRIHEFGQFDDPDFLDPAGIAGQAGWFF